MTTELKTTVTGRFIGGALFEPKADKNNPDKLRHNACIVLDAGDEKKVERIVENAVREKWGSKPPAGLQRWGVREGDDPEYATSFGQLFINPKSPNQPKILRKDGSVYQEVSAEDGVVYAGCFGAVSINAFAYDGDRKAGIKPGVTLGLRAFLFVKDGDPLGDHVDADSEFSGVDVVSQNDSDDFLAA